MQSPAVPSPPAVEPTGYSWPATRPPVLAQLRMWLWIGLRSFGGGPVVQLLLFDALVTRRRWLSPAEYARTWGLCQVVPGINLISFAVVIGSRIGGAAGIACGLIGMVVPGTLVIVLVTIGYSHIQNSALTRAGLRGGIAGVAGMGLFMAFRLLLPQLQESAAEGRFSLAASIGVFAAVAVGFFFLPRVPIVLIFFAAGAGMLLFGRLQRRAT